VSAHHTEEQPSSPGETFERSTRQRRAICDAFRTAEHPLAIGDVVQAARRSGASVSLTTAYRTVRALVEEGAVTAIELPGSGTVFESAGKAHHHHFSCLRCHRAYELADCALPDLAVPRGFVALSHETTVYGVCAACGSDPPKGAAP